MGGRIGEKCFAKLADTGTNCKTRKSEIFLQIHGRQLQRTLSWKVITSLQSFLLICSF